MVEKNKRILFALDLDGTVLSSSSERTINPVTILAIKRATLEGHVVCILTGRPWRATKEVYERLELTTTVVNYNGAYIHNPNPDSEFLPTIRYLDLNDVLYILGDKRLQDAKENLAIEGPSWVQIEKRAEKLEKVFGMNLSKNLKVGLDLNRLPLKPTGVVIDTKKDIDVNSLLRYLRRRYGDLVEFTSWSKGRDESIVLDITALNAKKDKALVFLSRYYGIGIDRVVAFGDGHNDVEMLEIAGIGVAMKNAEDEVKKHANTITDLDNEEGGVGHFINRILDNFEEFSNEMDKQALNSEANTNWSSLTS